MTLPLRVRGRSGTRCTMPGRNGLPSAASIRSASEVASAPGGSPWRAGANHQPLPFHRIGQRNGRHVAHERRPEHDRLDLGRPQPLAGNLQRVVRTAEDEELSVIVFEQQVAMRPQPGPLAPVRFLVAVGRVPESRRHPDERRGDHQFTGNAAHAPPLLVGRERVDARRYGVESARTDRAHGNIAQQRARRLRAAAVVDHRQPRPAERMEEPREVIRVDHLAGHHQHAQAVQHRAVDRPRRRRQTADQRGRRTEVRDLVAVDDFGQTPGVRIVGRAVVAHQGRAADKRADRRERADDPAHVARPQPAVAGAQLEVVCAIVQDLQREAGMRMHRALWRPCRSRCENDHERLVGVLLGERMGRRRVQRRSGVWRDGARRLVALDNDAQTRHPFLQCVEYRFQVDGASAAQVAAARQQHTRVGQRQSRGDGVRPEAGEQRHGDRAERRYGNQAGRGLRPHRHHDADPIARADAERAQPRRPLPYIPSQRGIAGRADAPVLRLRDDRRLQRTRAVRVRKHMIDPAQPTAGEPSRKRGPARKIDMPPRQHPPLELQVRHHRGPVALRLMQRHPDQIFERRGAHARAEFTQQRAGPPVGRWLPKYVSGAHQSAPSESSVARCRPAGSRRAGRATVQG